MTEQAEEHTGPEIRVQEVPRAAFAEAMRLLGIEQDGPDRALTSVHIEEGRITATYVQVGRVIPER